MPTKESNKYSDIFDSMFGKIGLKDLSFEFNAYPEVNRVVYHDPATIVFWKDGTKTVVKCIDGQPYEKYAGFCAALAKKIYGSTSKAKKLAKAKEKVGKPE